MKYQTLFFMMRIVKAFRDVLSQSGYGVASKYVLFGVSVDNIEDHKEFTLFPALRTRWYNSLDKYFFAKRNTFIINPILKG